MNWRGELANYVDERRKLNNIEDYLNNGGSFNPELMEPEKVRGFVVAMRDRIEALEAERDKLLEAGNWLAAEAQNDWKLGRVSVDLMSAVRAWQKAALQEPSGEAEVVDL